MTHTFDVLLQFTYDEAYRSMSRWSDAVQLGAIVRTRAATEEIMSPYRSSNGVRKRDLPPSKVPRAVHFFAPAAGSWHVYTDLPPEVQAANRTQASVARACARISVNDLDEAQPEVAANATCPAARAYASSEGVRAAIDAARRRGVLDHASPSSAHAACVLTATFCVWSRDPFGEGSCTSGYMLKWVANPISDYVCVILSW